MKKTAAHLKKHQFKKGEPSANPLGAKLHNPEIRAIKNLTESEMVEIGSLILKGSLDELKAIKDAPGTTALKAMMASVAIKTIAKGDHQALDALLNRLIGKVKDEVKIISNNTNSVSGMIGIIDEQNINAILKKIRDDV